MKTCPNCNNSVEDEALFCDSCGMKLPEEMELESKPEFIFCMNCGKKCTSDSTFCYECGASLEDKTEPMTANEPAYKTANHQRQTVKIPAMGKKLPLIGGLVALGLIIFVIISFLLIFIYTVNNLLTFSICHCRVAREGEFLLMDGLCGWKR